MNAAGSKTVSPLWSNLLPEPLRGVGAKCLGLSELDKIRLDALSSNPGSRAWEAALEALGVSCEATPGGLNHIPTQGPAIVVANHPHGVLDGLALMVLLRRVRPDVKVIANSLLGAVSEFRHGLILVDPYNGPGAAARNRAPLREGMEWLRRGGALMLFPAGDVAHFRLTTGRIEESAWNPIAARLSLKTGAPVLPAFITGQNSWAFQVLGLLHPRVRTAMLPREMLNKRGVRLRVTFGESISSKQVADAQSFTEQLRTRTLLLGTLGGRINEPAIRTKSARREPIADATESNVLQKELEGLAGFELVRTGSLRVFCCPAARIPSILREIGRMREITFREVGEGSGLSLDLDEFDEHYLHLFLWDEARAQIAGAYRLGLADEILAMPGLRGLYTRTLFRYGERLLSELGPAIELGRSFVAAPYQRSYAALLLLWKGIARFVHLHPHYRVLFGAVSISAEYDSMTRQLLMAFLRQNHFDSALSRLVRAKSPARLKRVGRAELRMLSKVVRSIDDADGLVRAIEQDRRGVPVLVRQYLQLNAKLLGFNIDPKFAHVLDGLFYVDLVSVDRRILSRYMGADDAADFLARHAGRQEAVLVGGD